MWGFEFVVFIASMSCLGAVMDRPVDRHVAVWDSVGVSSQSSNGGSFSTPFVGNGDIGAAVSIDNKHGGQSLMFGKSDYWRSDAIQYFTHLSAGKLSLDLVPVNTSDTFVAPGEQDLGNGVVRWSFKKVNTTIMSVSTIIGENNLVISTIICGTGGHCALDVNLGDTSNNCHKLNSSAGFVDNAIWYRKENIASPSNPAYLGSCDPFLDLYSVERSFVVDSHGGGGFSMSNGSCLWLDSPDDVAASTVSTGSCDVPQGKWRWVAHASVGSDGVEVTQRGDVMYVGTGVDTSVCLTHGVMVSADACGTGLWTFDINSTNTSLTKGYLGSTNPGSSGCLVVIPDNPNNTLAIAVSLLDASTNKVPSTLKMKPMQAPNHNANGIANVSSGFTVELAAGEEYVLLSAVLTLRDIDCSGTRERTISCASSIEQAALTLVKSNSDGATRAAVVQQQQAWWAAWWNASAIDFGSNNNNPNVTTVENFYYLQQYSLASTVRPGKIAPALIGNLVHHDPPAWNDQLTLDYNFEANFWGAGSSNHPEAYLPYIDTVTNPGIIATMRQRATNPGVWGPTANYSSTQQQHNDGKPSQVQQQQQHQQHQKQQQHHQQSKRQSENAESNLGWSIPVGHAASHAIIVPSKPPAVAPDLSQGAGFKGAAWTSTAYPLGDGRPDISDYQTRFVGGLVASDLIQYYEYTLDEDMLKSRIYPVVRDNALFYMSYVRDDPNNASLVYIPWGCGQEMCVCRNGGPGYGGYKTAHILPQRNMTKRCAAMDNKTAMETWNCPGAYGDTGMAGEHNAHADIAFAAQSFRKAIEYATVLGVDEDLQVQWQKVLGRLPPYPSVVLEFVEGAIGEEVNGQTLLTEGLTGPTVESLPWYNTSEPYFSGPVWPWCNSEYPISNYAAMWPTDEIGTLQTAGSPELLKAAKDTIWAINQYTGYDFAGSHLPWANSNGFCLSWPPAVRVATAVNSLDLINKFSLAITHRMAANGLVSFRGGMLENMGATIAMNDMLMQSHAGFVRFFPVWDATVLGAASFTTLRAYGAFLVSASVSAMGVVNTGVMITSLKGSKCQFISPWNKAPMVTTASGGVTVSPVSTQIGGFMFATTPNTTYILSPKSE